MAKMKNLEYIQALIGEGVTEKDLRNVDCFVHKKIGLFIPSTGQCGYAAKPQHTHPSYMVVVMFPNENSARNTGIKAKVNHYPASIVSPEIPHNDIFDEFNRYYCILIDKKYFELQFGLYSKELPCFQSKTFEICSDILKTLNTFAFECSKDMPNSDITLEAQSTIIVHWIIRSMLGENFDMRSISQKLFRCKSAAVYCAALRRANHGRTACRTGVYIGFNLPACFQKRNRSFAYRIYYRRKACKVKTISSQKRIIRYGNSGQVWFCRQLTFCQLL